MEKNTEIIGYIVNRLNPRAGKYKFITVGKYGSSILLRMVRLSVFFIRYNNNLILILLIVTSIIFSLCTDISKTVLYLLYLNKRSGIDF